MTKDEGTSNAIIISGKSAYLNNSSQRENADFSGSYLGSAAVTKCAIWVDAGTITGNIQVLKLAR